jgi:hypothetical protein
MSNHADTVREERAKYGSPLGEANAHKVINATAWRHRDEGWGLLSKPSGTNYNGCSIDVLINQRTSEAVDCLSDAEGVGGAKWDPIGWDATFAGRFVAPYDPSPVTPPQPPDPPPTGDVEARLKKVEDFLADTFIGFYESL